MPVPYKVRFDDDGSRCPRSIIELREKPECGVLFREEQPFKPDNRFPLPKGFELRHLGIIPKKINIPQGIMPSTIMPMKEDPRRLAFTENELPQDENQVNMSRRNNTYRTGYEYDTNFERIPEMAETELPPIRENIPEISKTFTHQEVDRVIQSLDDIMPTIRRDNLVDAVEEPVLEPPRPIVRQSRVRVLPDPPPSPPPTEFIEDDGAGVGTRPGDHSGRGGVGDDEPPRIVFKKRVSISPDTKDVFRKPKVRGKSRVRRVTDTGVTEPLGDPRDTEFTEKLKPRGVTDTEITETQIQQLKRKMPPDTHKKIKTSVEQELFPITAMSEEMEILKSIHKYVRKGRNQISQRELDTIIKDLTSRSVSLEKIMEVVNKYNAFDPTFEKDIAGVTDSQERAFLRRMKAVTTMIQDEPTLLSVEKQPSLETFEDTNLIPKDDSSFNRYSINRRRHYKKS
jgi:hypothetical protein